MILNGLKCGIWLVFLYIINIMLNKEQNIIFSNYICEASHNFLKNIITFKCVIITLTDAF